MSPRSLLLTTIALLAGCGVDHAEISPTDAPPPAASTDVPPTAERDPRRSADVGAPRTDDDVRVYVAGGADPTGEARDEVFSAAIGADGSLSDWRAEPSLPSRTEGVALTSTGKGILAVYEGGVLARIDDQPPQRWRWGLVSTEASLANAGVVTDGTSLLVLGGRQGERFVADGQLARLTDGRPGKFTATPNLPSPRAHVGVVRFGRTVLAVGGTRETGEALDEVLSSRVRTSGELDVWRPAPSLPRGLHGHAVVAAGDAVLVLGGSSVQRGRERTVSVSRLSDEGKISAWSDVGALPEALEGHCVVASGRNLFVLGGSTDLVRATDTVFATTVEIDGTLGRWRTLKSLPFPRVRAGCAVR